MSVDGAALDVAPRPARQAALDSGAAALSKVGFRRRLVGGLVALAAAAIVAQSFYVVQARPGDLITGVHGMVDIIRRAMPPAWGEVADIAWPALETVDLAIFGTVFGVLMAVPLAVMAAANVTPARPLYYLARGVIALTRAVPDLVWALLFVTAVGLGPFPGALALAVHSIGMLGRLFAEVIEDMDFGPVEALTLTGASRLQVFAHAVVPGVAPSLLGISLYRFDENLRSSLVLGFVGAGGLGFQLLTAMNLFQYQTVSLLLIATFILVMAAERGSALLRKQVA
jgi:phosphonate transport system permease protein